MITFNKVDVGYIVVKDDITYIALEYGIQGAYFKDSKAYSNKSIEVCYVPESAVEDLESYEFDFVEPGLKFYRLDDIESKYNYFDIMDITDNNQNRADIIFDIIDWQHPESLNDEMLGEEE